jgi:hypothetical protein
VIRRVSSADERGWPRSGQRVDRCALAQKVGRCRPAGRSPARKDPRAEPATGARNAKFVQGPYEPGSGPGGLGCSGSGPDGAARGRGGARNANFVQEPYEAGRGPGGGAVGARGTLTRRASRVDLSRRAGEVTIRRGCWAGVCPQAGGLGRETRSIPMQRENRQCGRGVDATVGGGRRRTLAGGAVRQIAQQCHAT